MPEVPAAGTSGFHMSNGFSWHLLHLRDDLRVSGTLRPSAHLLWPELSAAETPPHPLLSLASEATCPGHWTGLVVVFRGPLHPVPIAGPSALSDTYLLTASPCPPGCPGPSHLSCSLIWWPCL